MNKKEPGFESLIHEVNSKGSSLRDAAELLQKATPEERRVMLSLMSEQARSLANIIAEFEKRGAAAERRSL